MALTPASGDFLSGMRAQAAGTAPSEADMVQRMLLGAQQRAMLQAARTRPGTNPALASVAAAEQGAYGQGQALAQGAGMRFEEIARARRAMMDAQLRQQQMELERRKIDAGIDTRRGAAKQALYGSVLSGLFGLGGTALAYGMSPGAPAQPETIRM